MYLLKAMYTDRGSDVVGASTSQQIHAFRSNQVKAVDLDQQENMQIFKTDKEEVVLISGPGYFSFNQIDLTDINSVSLEGSVNGAENETTIEVRLDSADGQKIAETTLSDISKPIKINPVNSTHDVYFVAKVPESGGSGGRIATITFNP
jgi:cytochrome c